MGECIVGGVSGKINELIGSVNITDSVACPDSGTTYKTHTISITPTAPRIILEIVGTATWHNIPQYYGPDFSINLGDSSASQRIWRDSVGWSDGISSKQFDVKRILTLVDANQYFLGATGYTVPLKITVGASGHTPCTISYTFDVKIFGIND